MTIRVRHLLVPLCVVLILGPIAQPACASPPSGKWVNEGGEKLLKIAFMEAVKKLLPGGEVAAKVNSWAIDPLIAASTTEGSREDKINAWLIALGQAGVKAAWPPYGITMAGGKIIVGGSIYTVEEMVAAAHDQQVQAIITGKGTGGLLDRVNNVMAETPFVDLPLVRNRGITADNIGGVVHSEAELQSLWFGSYGSQLRDLYGPNNAKTALDEGWPRLLQMWQAQRAEAGLDEFVSKLDVAMQVAQEKVAHDASLATADTSGTFDSPPSALDFAGTYTSPAGPSTITISGSGGSFTAHEDWESGGRNGKNDWKNCQANGNVLKCDWTGVYLGDPDKTGDRKGTVTVTLDGVRLTGSYMEDEPVFHWNVAPYPSAMHKGAVWPIDYVREGS